MLQAKHQLCEAQECEAVAGRDDRQPTPRSILCSGSRAAPATQAYQREQLVVPGRFDVVVTSYEMVIKVRPSHGCREVSYCKQGPCGLHVSA